CLLTVLVAALMVWWAREWFRRKTDLSLRPPDVAFRQVFLMSPPSGVRHLRIAGESHLSGIVWMRSEVDDPKQVILAMEGNPKLTLVGSDECSRDEYYPSGDVVFADRYATSVDWADVFQIKKPYCYRFTWSPPNQGWYGILVVDEKNRTVYAQGGLL
ncbi:MAG: hypothetical protein HY318_19190, partial [Armatimonadetes bacterium]|nr:hypothetical protein [Armatimonadota bacterium]